jgi:hypothetical protein
MVTMYPFQFLGRVSNDNDGAITFFKKTGNEIYVTVFVGGQVTGTMKPLQFLGGG